MFMRLSEDEKRVIADFLEDEGVERVELFGSYSRGEASESSDVDLLVEFSGSKSLLEVVGLERRLSELIGKDVDVVTRGSLNNLIRVDGEVLKG